MTSMLRMPLLAPLLVLAACATPVAPAPNPDSMGADAAKGIAAEAVPPAAPTSVLLVSVDGLGAGMLDAAVAPRISAMADGGVRARWMTPSYPSLTFPNHTTLVTGLRPDRHGIVHNTMEDPVLGRFAIHLSGKSDPAWWDGALPVWVSAERAGLPTATYFWPGSDSPIRGVRPTRWQPYDGSVSNEARVDTVVGWLSESPATRPRFATLYFSDVDHAAHDHGPDSPEARAAIGAVDAAIGRLLDGLRERGVAHAVDIVLVSDHGMVAVPPTQVVSTDAMVDPSIARAVSTGQSVGFAPLPGREAEAEARLLGPHEGYYCWRKERMPVRWAYGHHSRVPPIVCQMFAGWDALAPERLARRDPTATRGSHGYDPDSPAMRAVFVASGPSFRRGVVLRPIDNVDVYPLLMHLLGLEPAPNNGDDDALAALRADPDAGAALVSESGE